jgi:hypothetical protein
MEEVTTAAAPEAAAAETPATSDAGQASDGATEPAEAPPPDERALRVARLNAIASSQREALVAKRSMVAERSRVAQLRAQANAPPPEEVAWSRQLRERAKTDPIGVLEEMGATTEQLVHAAIKRGTPEEKLAALEARLAERDERDRRQEMERRSQAQAQVRDNAVNAFVATAKSDESRWPSLNDLMTERQLREAGWAVATDASAKGHSYTDEEILDYLESREQPRYKKIRDKLATSGQSGSRGQQDSAKSAAPKTLSHRSSQTMGGSLDISKLSKVDQIKALTEMYDGILRRGK